MGARRTTDTRSVRGPPEAPNHLADRTERLTTVATITGGRTVSPVLSPCDTPGGAAVFSPQAAEAAWRTVTPSIAATPHVRLSFDAGRTYPAKHARRLPADPPAAWPSVVPVYDPATASGRMLVLDLDPARGDVDHQGSRHHPAQKQRLGSRSGNGSVRYGLPRSS